MENYVLRFTQSEDDIKLAQAFRGKLFRSGQIDRDPLDENAIHGLITNREGVLVCAFRMLAIDHPDQLDGCYSAQYYDLTQVKAIGGKSLELGRFCVDPAYSDPEIIRMAWAELTKFVLERDIDLLFGCSSFTGTDLDAHEEALALLKERHLAPKRLMPRIKAPKVFEFAKLFRLKKPNLKIAQKAMPPLLRSYLMMGGWVSDHAVIDHDLDTIHVFTGVQIKKIPPARRKLFLNLSARLPSPFPLK